MGKKQYDNEDYHLSGVAKTFLEMGEYEFESHKDIIKKNKSMRFAIGYVAEQSIELYLKQISNILFSRYPEKHDLVIICDFLMKNISKPGNTNGNVSIVVLTELKNLIKVVLENAQLYGGVAYGAKYKPDLEFSYEQLEELLELAKDIEKFYIKNVEDLIA